VYGIGDIMHCMELQLLLDGYEDITGCMVFHSSTTTTLTIQQRTYILKHSPTDQSIFRPMNISSASSFDQLLDDESLACRLFEQILSTPTSSLREPASGGHLRRALERLVMLRSVSHSTRDAVDVYLTQNNKAAVMVRAVLVTLPDYHFWIHKNTQQGDDTSLPEFLAALCNACPDATCPWPMSLLSLSSFVEPERRRAKRACISPCRHTVMWCRALEHEIVERHTLTEEDIERKAQEILESIEQQLDAHLA